MKKLITINVCALALLLVACGGPSKKPVSAKRAEIKTVQLGKRKVGKAAPAMPGVNVPAIKVDTVGYQTDWKKVIIFNVDPKGAVVKDAAGKVALKITDTMIIKNHGIDESSKDPVWQVDITSLNKPGKYTAQVGDATSDVFEIADDVYKMAVIAGIKSFYFQRTRIPLVEPYAVWEGDKYLRKKASHVHEDVGWDFKYFPEKKKKWRKLEAGWHDAGNFDMYVQSTAPTSQMLLMAYESMPEYFKDKDQNIPESGDGIPDLLGEIKFGLDWVLSMQEIDGEDKGAFRARESVIGSKEAPEWSPEGPADEDMTTRWVSEISTTATGKAISVLAMAAQIYAKWDKAYAKKCEDAALSAWAWLQKHPDHIRALTKGVEGQPSWDDELDYKNDRSSRFAAATEMWIRLRNKEALEQVIELMKTRETRDADALVYGSWSNICRWGLIDLAKDEGTSDEIRAEAAFRLLAAAEFILPQTLVDGYLCATPPDNYYWGHNANLMERAQLLAAGSNAAKLLLANKKLTAKLGEWRSIKNEKEGTDSFVVQKLSVRNIKAKVAIEKDEKTKDEKPVEKWWSIVVDGELFSDFCWEKEAALLEGVRTIEYQKDGTGDKKIIKLTVKSDEEYTIVEKDADTLEIIAKKDDNADTKIEVHQKWDDAAKALIEKRAAQYKQAARDQWHWINGRNPNGYSMVSRVGKGPDRLYHMEWGPYEPPPPGILVGGPNHENMGFLSPDAPAKALLWDNPEPLRSGLPPHSLWHWKQSDLWDSGFLAEDSWVEGWWDTTESDILYSADYVLAGMLVK